MAESTPGHTIAAMDGFAVAGTGPWQVCGAVRAGTHLASPGIRIGPALLGLAAACGYDAMQVRPRPRVQILVTGDELVHRGRPGPGQVRDALGPMLPSLVQDMGGQAVAVRHVPDRPGALTDAFATADAAEALAVTGST